MAVVCPTAVSILDLVMKNKKPVYIIAEPNQVQLFLAATQKTTPRCFYDKELHCDPASRDILKVTSQNCLSPKDQIHLYSRKSCRNIKVNFVIECIGGNISVDT